MKYNYSLIPYEDHFHTNYSHNLENTVIEVSSYNKEINFYWLIFSFNIKGKGKFLLNKNAKFDGQWFEGLE